MIISINTLFCFFRQCILRTFSLRWHKTNASLLGGCICSCLNLFSTWLFILVSLFNLRKSSHIQAWDILFGRLRHLYSNLVKAVGVLRRSQLHLHGAPLVSRAGRLLFEKRASRSGLDGSFGSEGRHRVWLARTHWILHARPCFHFECNSCLFSLVKFLKWMQDWVLDARLLRLQHLVHVLHFELSPTSLSLNHSKPNCLSACSYLVPVNFFLLLHLPLVQLKKSRKLLLLRRLKVLALVQR